MNYIRRDIEKQLQKMVGAFPAVMIIGSRQTGKSTLLEYVSMHKKMTYDMVTLDNVLLADEANAHPEQFLGTFRRPLVVDEFQYAPNLTSYMKIEIDQARKDSLFGKRHSVGTIFYLTGSQIFNAKDTVRESLAGRVGILRLYGLSTREIESTPEATFSPVYADIKKRKPTKHLSEKELYTRIVRGSYPELYSNKKIDTEQFYSSYIQTYIERDIRRQIRPENEYNFVRFLSLLAARTGQELIIANLSNELSVDAKTLTSWLSLLEASGIVFLLRPYYNNDSKRVSKKPKIYFTDTGLACFLSGYHTPEAVMNSAYKGHIFETHVVMEILKSLANSGAPTTLGNLFFYRSSNRSESDLLMKINDTFYPIEIKSTDSPSIDDTKWFSELKSLGLKCGEGIVICRSSSRVTLGENNYAIPLEYI